MTNEDTLKKLLVKIAEIGKQHPDPPQLHTVFPFRYYFDKNGILIHNKLSENDGLWTRREILTRYLFLQSVLDQGTHIEGIRHFLADVTNSLYEKEIHFLHKPIDFFRELRMSVDELLQHHEAVKGIYAAGWAKENQSSENRYSVMTFDGKASKQVLNYAVHRWGVPLAVPYLLEKDMQKSGDTSSEPLVDYLERFSSAEEMSQEIKDDVRYGLGKAIGDKAAHLFAKWYIHSFELAKRKDDTWSKYFFAKRSVRCSKLAKRKDDTWSKYSYELPMDSNVGRVLFRTGFLLKLATLQDYQDKKIIQLGRGKEGTDLLRVTNIRKFKPTLVLPDSTLGKKYPEVMKTYFGRRQSTIKIQRLPNVLLLGTEYSIGDLDDGCIYIGTNFCFNHDSPKCAICPINELCEGFQNQPELIENYRT